MGLTSIIKIQFNNVKKILIISLSVLTVLSLLLFIPFNDNIKYYLGSSIMLFSAIFLVFLSTTLYGGFGKTYAFLQNNRLIYSLSMVIWNVCISIIYTIILSIMKIALNSSGFNIQFMVVILLTSISIFSVSSTYSLYFKYHKVFKKILLLLLLIAILFFNKSIFTFIQNINQELTIGDTLKYALFNLEFFPYLIIVLSINIIINVINLIYYCRFNIIKNLT